MGDEGGRACQPRGSSADEIHTSDTAKTLPASAQFHLWSRSCVALIPEIFSVIRGADVRLFGDQPVFFGFLLWTAFKLYLHVRKAALEGIVTGFPRSVHVKTVHCSQSQTAPLSFSTTMWGKKIYKAGPKTNPFLNTGRRPHFLFTAPIGKRASQRRERFRQKPSRMGVRTRREERPPPASFGGSGRWFGQRFMV